jgi:hypothetical protein
MRKLIPILAAIPLVLWVACGDDDGPTDSNGPTAIRVIADQTVGTPSLDDPNDPVWDNVLVTALDIDETIAPKLGPPIAARVSDSVWLQVIKHTDSLFLRVVWDDDSLHLLKDAFMVTAPSPGVQFAHNKDAFHEDQLIVMFTLPDSTWWDVWNWRSLTTGPSHLAEGRNYDTSVVDTLISDSGVNKAAWVNPALPGSSTPTYLHQDTSAFQGLIFHFADRVNYRYCLGWEVGQVIPGWMVDTHLVTHVADFPESRWDIKAADDYDAASDRYTVVMGTKLNTGSEKDDMDLSVVDSVKVKIGLLDDQTRLDEAGSRRGFTAVFWIIL